MPKYAAKFKFFFVPQRNILMEQPGAIHMGENDCSRRTQNGKKICQKI